MFIKYEVSYRIKASTCLLIAIKACALYVTHDYLVKSPCAFTRAIVRDKAS